MVVSECVHSIDQTTLHSFNHSFLITSVMTHILWSLTTSLHYGITSAQRAAITQGDTFISKLDKHPAERGSIIIRHTKLISYFKAAVVSSFTQEHKQKPTTSVERSDHITGTTEHWLSIHTHTHSLRDICTLYTVE